MCKSRKKIYSLAIILLILNQSCMINKKPAKCFIEEYGAKEMVRENKKYVVDYKKIEEIESFAGNFFTGPSKIQLYNDELYLLDSGAECIYVCNSNLRGLRVIGKKGKGPGEFCNLKDFIISDDHIYCLDNSKMTISKYSIYNDFIYEKKVPDQIYNNISLENIELFKGKFYLSGFHIAEFIKFQSCILYSFGKDFMHVNEYLTLSSQFGNFDFYEKVVKSANIIDCDDSNLYIGMLIGTALLYSFNPEENSINFVIKEKSFKKNNLSLIDNKLGTEILTYFNVTDIVVNDDYIIICEDAGGMEKNNSNVNNEDYFNNISFFNKDGSYLFSFKDGNLPYSISGYKCAEKHNESFIYLFLTSIDNCILYKYKLDKKNIS